MRAEDKPVITVTDIKLPKVCAGCGGHGALLPVRLFNFKTQAGGGGQIIPYCKECAEYIAMHLIRSWE